jgi:hypothetical protein
MAPPHNTKSKSAERRKQRRQRRAQQGGPPQRAATEPRMAPLNLDDRKRGPRTVASSVLTLDPEVEYRFVRRDLWRLAIYSVICFVLMLGVLFFLEG